MRLSPIWANDEVNEWLFVRNVGRSLLMEQNSAMNVAIQHNMALWTEQKIFRFMDGVGSVSYSYNDDLYTLIFWIE